MPDLTRRQFVTTATTAAAGTALFSPPLGAEPAAKPRRAGSDMVALGKSGLKTTLLGIGTGTRGGSEQRNMGSDKFTKMIRHALDRGIRFLDTADRYMTHVYFQQALKEVKREDYFLLTKVWSRTIAILGQVTRSPPMMKRRISSSVGLATNFLSSRRSVVG